jgi:hypothetical protein
MGIHIVEFPILLDPPHPFAASDFEFNGLYLMGEWHAGYSANLGCCAAFACPEARAVLDIDTPALLSLPRTWRTNLGNLSYRIMVIMARLTFSTGNAPGARAVYGALDSSWGISKLETIQDWLMDADACPTEWATLLRIRRANPHYGAHVPTEL